MRIHFKQAESDTISVLREHLLKVYSSKIMLEKLLSGHLRLLMKRKKEIKFIKTGAYEKINANFFVQQSIGQTGQYTTLLII